MFYQTQPDLEIVEARDFLYITLPSSLSRCGHCNVLKTTQSNKTEFSLHALESSNQLDEFYMRALKSQIMNDNLNVNNQTLNKQMDTHTHIHTHTHTHTHALTSIGQGMVCDNVSVRVGLGAGVGVYVSVS